MKRLFEEIRENNNTERKVTFNKSRLLGLLIIAAFLSSACVSQTPSASTYQLNCHALTPLELVDFTVNNFSDNNPALITFDQTADTVNGNRWILLKPGQNSNSIELTNNAPGLIVHDIEGGIAGSYYVGKNMQGAEFTALITATLTGNPP